jgi:hypothetical protein
MTKQKTYQAQLEAIGFKRADHRSGKYIKMSHPLSQLSIFLGRAGAFRVGRIASETVCVTDPARAIESIEAAIKRKEQSHA